MCANKWRNKSCTSFRKCIHSASLRARVSPEVCAMIWSTAVISVPCQSLVPTEDLTLHIFGKERDFSVGAPLALGQCRCRSRAASSDLRPAAGSQPGWARAGLKWEKGSCQAVWFGFAFLKSHVCIYLFFYKTGRRFGYYHNTKHLIYI